MFIVALCVKLNLETIEKDVYVKRFTVENHGNHYDAAGVDKNESKKCGVQNYGGGGGG